MLSFVATATEKTVEKSVVSVKDREKERLKMEKQRKEKDDVAQNQGSYGAGKARC